MTRTLLFVLIFLFGGTTTFAEHLQGTVTEVLDGDTITVSIDGNETEYSLLGIASPVLGQPVAEEAKRYTESLLLGKSVTLTPSFRQIDRTWVAKVTVNGSDIRYRILIKGYAWCYMTNESWLKDAAREAKRKKSGIWSATNPIPPWKFRPPSTSISVSKNQTSKKPVHRVGNAVQLNRPNNSAGIEKSTTLFTNNRQIASAYGQNSVIIKNRHQQAELMAKVAPKLPPSKYDDFLNSVVVIQAGNSLGSGFFFDRGGLIVTNHHVIEGNTRVVVGLRDETKKEGRVVSVDRDRDLALIEVEDFQHSWLGLGKIEDAGIGSEVMAIGAPEGLSWSVSKGVVSAIRSNEKSILIQTDTAINHGNSGGPLISLESGKVVGVNTFGIRKDIAEGLNFAVSVDEIRQTFSKYIP